LLSPEIETKWGHRTSVFGQRNLAQSYSLVQVPADFNRLKSITDAVLDCFFSGRQRFRVVQEWFDFPMVTLNRAGSIAG